jgi:hypothetical protein
VGFRDWLCQKHKIATDGDRPQQWDLSIWLNLSPNETRLLVEEFNASDDFRFIPVVDGAARAVRALRDDGWTINVVSSCGDDPGTTRARRWALAIMTYLISASNNDPIFSNIICLPLHADKEPILRGLPPGVWVEDNHNGALQGLRAGHAPFMLRQPHNREWEKLSPLSVKWFDSWEEISRELLSR